MVIWKQLAFGFILVINACSNPATTPVQPLTPTTLEPVRATSPELEKTIQKASIARQNFRRSLYQWAQKTGIIIGDAYFCPRLNMRAEIFHGHVALIGYDLDDTISTRAFESSLSRGIALGVPGLSCTLIEKHLNSTERGTNDVQRLILEASQQDKGLTQKP